MGYFDNPYTNYDFGSFFAPPKKKNPYTTGLDQPALSPEELPGNQVDFGFPKESDTSSPETGTDKYSASQYLRDIQDAFTKESQASTEYRRHMTQMPTENISGWRRVGAAATAGLLALGGNRNALETSQEVLHAPYRRDLARWQLQGEGLKTEADIQNKNLQTRLGYAKDLMGIEKEASDEAFKNRREGRLSSTADFKRQLDTNKFMQRQVMDKWRQEHGNAQFDLAQAHEDWRQSMGESQLAQGEERIGVAKRNAATAERNAGTNAQRANIYGQASEDASSRGWYGLDLKEQGGTSAEPQYNPGSAINQVRAGAEAARRLVINNPRYAKYVDSEGKIVPPTQGGGIFSSGTPVAPKDDPEFAKFLADYEKERTGILTKPGKKKRVASQPVGPQLPKAMGGLKF